MPTIVTELHGMSNYDKHLITKGQPPPGETESVKSMAAEAFNSRHWYYVYWAWFVHRRSVTCSLNACQRSAMQQKERPTLHRTLHVNRQTVLCLNRGPVHVEVGLEPYFLYPVHLRARNRWSCGLPRSDSLSHHHVQLVGLCWKDWLSCIAEYKGIR